MADALTHISKRSASGFLAAAAFVVLSQNASATAWGVRVQALGTSEYSNYSFCGSSDGSVNCSTVYGDATGNVTYYNGGTKIEAEGFAQGTIDPGGYAGGKVTADLKTATIRQSNSNVFGNSGTSGTIADQLVFYLPDPYSVFAIPFSYSFEGNLSGDSGSYFHPGLYAQSYFSIGSASIGSTQSIGESGPDYFPPTIGLSNGSNDWIDLIINQSSYGYTIAGKVLVGGGWGNVLDFNMNSQVSCENEYGFASCDYSHTQVFDFGDLPAGVSYVSQSGVFLSKDQGPGGPLPEISTWILMIGGIGAMGAAGYFARYSGQFRAKAA